LHDPGEWAKVMTDYPVGHPITVLPTNIQDLLTDDVVKKYNPWMSTDGIKSWNGFLQLKSLPNIVMWPLSEHMWNFGKVCYDFCHS
jgi:hypothetical protein